ncbi:MAG: hypothetical protein Q9180_005779 [Flavoplaca navasiana]
MDGVYGDEYFGDPMTPEGKSKRLRAVIQDILLGFAEDMRMNGQKSIIVDDTTESATEREIYHCDYLDHVGDLMRRTRGRELPGTFNPLIIGDLFYEQSMPWKAMTDRYCESILNVIKKTVSSTIDNATDSATAEGLLQTLLYPALDTRKVQFNAKVAEVLEPHRCGHAITYNHYFTDAVQKARNEHQQEEQARRLRDFFGVGPNQDLFCAKQSYKVSEVVESLAGSTQEDMDRYACSEATYCMEAYYKVALKVLVDNFSVLAVEQCLLRNLADILSPDIIIKLSDDEVNALAAESETSMLERRRATDELATLQEGLTVLNRFSQLRAAARREILASLFDNTCSLISDKDTIVDDDDKEDDEGALTALDDDLAPSIQFTETKDDNIAIPHGGHEAPVPIREKPKRQAAMTQEYRAHTPSSYEEAIPVNDDSGTYYGEKNLKKAKKKSRVSQYAVHDEPPSPPRAPYEATMVSTDDDKDRWVSFGVSAIKKNSASKTKGKVAPGVLAFEE